MFTIHDIQILVAPAMLKRDRSFETDKNVPFHFLFNLAKILQFVCSLTDTQTHTNIHFPWSNWDEQQQTHAHTHTLCIIIIMEGTRTRPLAVCWVRVAHGETTIYMAIIICILYTLKRIKLLVRYECGSGAMWQAAAGRVARGGSQKVMWPKSWFVKPAETDAVQTEYSCLFWNSVGNQKKKVLFKIVEYFSDHDNNIMMMMMILKRQWFS